MALEEELMTQEAEAKQLEEKLSNPDDLTEDEIEAVKELKESAGWEVLKKCMEKRVKKQEEDLVVLAREHFMEPKKFGYTAFEVLGGLIKGMGEMERLVNVITVDPEDVKKAVEEMTKAEESQIK